MLISFTELKEKYQLKVTGILHIGACECEELDSYEKNGIKKQDIIWLEANPTIVKKNQAQGIPNVFELVVSDKDDQITNFIITNNLQSSSLLELEQHKIKYPHIQEKERIQVKTTTINTFFKQHPEYNSKKYNFVNIDIQGAELLALKGMTDLFSSSSIDYIYLEVNKEKLYKDCALEQDIIDFLAFWKFQQKETKWTEYGWGDSFFIKTKESKLVPPRMTTLVNKNTHNLNEISLIPL